ncbi:MAG TPA: hypothetical protein VD793_01085, partial [Gemmatimonadales bacterium]|nr:hypothetical protein [Gemmatimonadales bacterium]
MASWLPEQYSSMSHSRLGLRAICASYLIGALGAGRLTAQSPDSVIRALERAVLPVVAIAGEP